MRFKTSLRTRLLLTMSAALSPILILALFQAVADVQNSRDIRQQELIIKADVAIDRVEQNLSEAELLLDLYSTQIAAGGCGAVFERLTRQRPILANVVAVDADGMISCTARGDANEAINDPAWHAALRGGRETLRSNAFYGEMSGVWLFAIFRRITDEQGEFAGSVGFGLRAEALGNPFRSRLSDSDIDVAIADREGRVFGTALFERVPAEWIETADIESRATLNVHTQDGTSYDTVVTPLGAGGVFGVMSRPSPELISAVMLQPVRSFGLPVLAFFVTLLAAWWAVDDLVLKWIRRLTRVAGIYGRGRYGLTDVETVSRAPTEISELAGSLDQMASRVAEREVELTDAIATRDAAVKEIHHRVKNNLQIVSSFLNLEARASRNTETKRVLGNARNRISALSIVHQTLYQHERLDSVELAPFLEALLSHLRGALGMEEAGVELSWDVENIVRDSDDAIPLALLVLELITNAMKHAFDEDGGAIDVTLKQSAGGLLLTVSDNGRGMSENSDAGLHKGLGTRLINAFTRQLKAELNTRSAATGGYSVELAIPDTDTT